MSTASVIAGDKTWHVEQADCIAWLDGLPADSVSLVMGSPPYEAARTYGIDFNLRGQDWVSWMVKVYLAATRVCTGLVAFVVEGQTRQYRWSATPALLMADLHRVGLHLRRPVIYHRVGIPGSGGPDWLRADTEYVVCVARPGKLPWSDTTALGHPPKWQPGGAMSYRNADGSRKARLGRGNANGIPGSTKGSCIGRRVPRGHELNGKILEEDAYIPPALANPGNLIHCNVGGGMLGSPLAHANEAPYPEKLAEFFVLSFCQPNGIVADCFAGSGTTLSVAVANGRRAIGCDIRQNQVDLARRRIESVTPMMFVE